MPLLFRKSGINSPIEVITDKGVRLRLIGQSIGVGWSRRMAYFKGKIKPRFVGIEHEQEFKDWTEMEITPHHTVFGPWSIAQDLILFKGWWAEEIE